MSEALAELESPIADYSAYSHQTSMINEICERLAVGESLASIVRDPRMPSWGTVYAWRDRDPETVERFRHAREVGEEALASRLRLVAKGEEGFSSGDPQRDKLIIDTDFKLLAKMNPRKWGESTQLRHADADGGKLDTGPLVGELLTLMQPGASQPASSEAPRSPAEPPRAIVQARPQVSYREITPAPAPTQHNARPAYRPRVARDDVGDLV